MPRQAFSLPLCSYLKFPVRFLLSTTCCRLPLLEVHCAVWPHKIAAAVYAPLSATGHVACAEELGTEAGLKKAGSWMAWLGLRSGACPYAGWSLARLKQHVRAAQRRAQKTGARKGGCVVGDRAAAAAHGVHDCCWDALGCTGCQVLCNRVAAGGSGAQRALLLPGAPCQLTPAPAYLPGAPLAPALQASATWPWSCTPRRSARSWGRRRRCCLQRRCRTARCSCWSRRWGGAGSGCSLVPCFPAGMARCIEAHTSRPASRIALQPAPHACAEGGRAPRGGAAGRRHGQRGHLAASQLALALGARRARDAGARQGRGRRAALCDLRCTLLQIACAQRACAACCPAPQALQEGQVLVLPGFQLSPEGAAVAQLGGGRRGLYPELEVLQEAVNVVTAGAWAGLPVCRRFAGCSCTRLCQHHDEASKTLELPVGFSAPVPSPCPAACPPAPPLQPTLFQRRASSRSWTCSARGGRRCCRTEALPAARTPRCPTPSGLKRVRFW